MSAVDDIKEFVIAFDKAGRERPPRITVAVTEKTIRRSLGLRKKDALVYEGIPLYCIGSRRWRLARA